MQTIAGKVFVRHLVTMLSLGQHVIVGSRNSVLEILICKSAHFDRHVFQVEARKLLQTGDFQVVATMADGR